MGAEADKAKVEAKAAHMPGPVAYSCSSCGWSGHVSSRPRCLKCAAARTAAWRKAHPDHARLLRRNWAKRKGAAYAAKRKRIRRANNPETTKAAWRRRVDWLRAGDVTETDLRDVFFRCGGRCVYCGEVVVPRFSPADPRGFDHVVARANGGKHTKSNLVVACGNCNAEKSDREV